MRTITMSKQELRKGEIIGYVVIGKMTQRRASQELQISLRQVKRLCKRYREEGMASLTHRSRGRASNYKIAPSIREKVLRLLKSDYVGFGPQLAKEQLESRQGIYVSREWVRKLMIKESIWHVRKRKVQHVYQRRERRAREGELLQIDASPDHWFGDRGPLCSLISMVDDATGKLMECRFVEQECLEGYFKALKRYIKKYGRPLAIYSDKHTIFKSPKSEDKPSDTQFGRAMKELGIELIFANSPQAKGRVERSHGTVQDRLIKLMKLDNINSIEEGNRYLEGFREDYNKRFGRVPKSKENAHRKLAAGMVLEHILCKKQKRKVSKSLEIQYKHATYQLVQGKESRKLKGKTVLMSERENGVVIELNGKEYKYKIYEEQPYVEQVLDSKNVNVFLNKKTPLTVVEKRRKGIVISF